MDALKNSDFADKLKFVDAPLADQADLLLAHPQSYIDFITSSAPTAGFANLDGDTSMSPGTLQAALRAAGAGKAAVDAVLAGEYSGAFCAVRPPGHHATRDRAMGFCIFSYQARPPRSLYLNAPKPAFSRHGAAGPGRRRQ
jgi:acetoin utilization deacetylase AcuC-like enzyme